MRRLHIAVAASSLLWPSVLWLAAEPMAVAAEGLGAALAALQTPPADPDLPLEVSPQALPPADPEGEEEESNSDPIPPADAVGSTAPVWRSTVRRVPMAGARSSAPRLPTPERGLRVSAPTVLRLANARVIPEGSYRPATREHPGGMVLRGVSRLGVGLRDGDVLTHVAGAPATSRSAVVAAVLAARAKRAPAISATFLRQGEPWSLTVEMPYLRPSRAAPEQAVAPRGQPPGSN